MNRVVGIAKRALIIIGVVTIGAVVGGKLYWQFHDRIPVMTPVGTISPPIAWEQMLGTFLWILAGVIISCCGAFVISRLCRSRSNGGSDA